MRNWDTIYETFYKKVLLYVVLEKIIFNRFTYIFFKNILKNFLKFVHKVLLSKILLLEIILSHPLIIKRFFEIFRIRPLSLGVGFEA